MDQRNLPKLPEYSPILQCYNRPTSVVERTEQSSQRRKKAVHKLYDTEAKYNMLLSLIITYYVTPLYDAEIITTEQHEILFHQFNSIKVLSDKLLKDLNRDLNSPNDIKLSDLFNTFIPFFERYQYHLNNHQKTLQILQMLSHNKQWIAFHQKALIKCPNIPVPLRDSLILPSKQLIKYNEILSIVITNTNQNHQDYNDLTKTHQLFRSEVEPMESKMKEYNRQENIRKIQLKFKGKIDLLSPYRSFIFEGKLWKMSSRNRRSKDRLYHFFLFNDLLIYASSFGNKYKLHNMLPINAQFVVDTSKTDTQHTTKEKQDRMFSIKSEVKSFTVFANTASLAQEWIQHLNICIAQENAPGHSGSITDQCRRRGITAETLPIWIPDTDHNGKHCSMKGCNVKFSFTKRKRHCTKCNAVVCSKCSKYQVLNNDGVKQRACKRCFFLHSKLELGYNRARSAQILHSSYRPKAIANYKQRTLNVVKVADVSYTLDRNEDLSGNDSEASDFENEIRCLYAFSYYIETTHYHRIFEAFGHGIGSYMLVPSDVAIDAYYCVNLMVDTGHGFESFQIYLFEKHHMMFRLIENRRTIRDFNDMNQLMRYVQDTYDGIKFMYPVSRVEVERADNYKELYPKGYALYDYESKIDGDLNFKAGDRISIWDRNDPNGWWKGALGDRVGIFPSNYVRLSQDIHDENVSNEMLNVGVYDAIVFGDDELKLQTPTPSYESDDAHVNILKDADGGTKQFYNFLRQHKLQKYFNEFKLNECCDIRDIEYLMDEDEFLRENIGIKNLIHRKKLVGELRKLKERMDVFSHNIIDIIPEILVLKLSEHGVVTMDILCNEIARKSDLNDKFGIHNDNQSSLLWNIVEMQMKPLPRQRSRGQIEGKAQKQDAMNVIKSDENN